MDLILQINLLYIIKVLFVTEKVKNSAAIRMNSNLKCFKFAVGLFEIFLRSLLFIKTFYGDFLL